MDVAKTAGTPQSLTMELVVGLVAGGVFTLLVTLSLAWLYWERGSEACSGGHCRQIALAEQPPREIATPMAQRPAEPADTPQMGVGTLGWPLALPTHAPVVAVDEALPAHPLPVLTPTEAPMEPPDQQRVQERADLNLDWGASVVINVSPVAPAMPPIAMRRSPMRIAPTAKHVEAIFPGDKTPTLRSCPGQVPLEPGLVCELQRNGSRWVISLLPFSHSTGEAAVRECWSGLLLIPGWCVTNKIDICPNNCPLTIAEALAPLPLDFAHWSPRPW
jgi:hypothetical protein